MTTQNFCYWLQGFFEIAEPKFLDEKQIQIIKNHLNLVFEKITPHTHSANVSGVFDLIGAYDTKTKSGVSVKPVC